MVSEGKLKSTSLMMVCRDHEIEKLTTIKDLGVIQNRSGSVVLSLTAMNLNRDTLAATDHAWPLVTAPENSR